jgi:hypothetical protein
LYLLTAVQASPKMDWTGKATLPEPSGIINRTEMLLMATRTVNPAAIRDRTQGVSTDASSNQIAAYVIVSGTLLLLLAGAIIFMAKQRVV